MIETGETDVIGPSVAAHSPYGLLAEHVGAIYYSVAELRLSRSCFTVVILQRFNKSFACRERLVRFMISRKPCRSGGNDRRRSIFYINYSLCCCGKRLSALTHCHCHTITIFCIILEERIAPSRTSSVAVAHAISVAWIIGAPHRRTSGGVRHQHTLTEKLSK